MRRLSTALALALVACGGEPRSAAPQARTPIVEASAAEEREVAAPPAADDAPAPVVAPGVEDPFSASLPTTPCPPAARVAIAHASQAELPTWLERAVAFRSEDGRRVRVAIANHALALDDAGRFPTPELGQARFEMDATRSRRGPLEPRVLGAPGSRHGGLSHARIVGPEVLLTFGHRNVGRVELTELTAEHVCGRIELDDGFGRVRGAFRADVIGTLPE